MEIRSARTHHVERSVADVWEAINRVDDYRGWWPWLRQLDASGLEEGDEWACTVQPPLPYALRFTIAIDSVLEDGESRRVDATVAGDIVGTARLDLTPAADGCDVGLTAALRSENRALQVVSTLAPWMARFGHDWVINTGLDQFRHRAW